MGRPAIFTTKEMSKEEKQRIYRERSYYKNRVEILLQRKIKWASDSEYREHNLEVNKKYRKKHRKILATKQHQRYLKVGGEYFDKRRKIKRKLILAKFGSKCQRCGYSEFDSALDIHHIKGRKTDPELVIVLCRNCHHALHSKKWKFEELKKLGVN